jgi:hypothetical protein
MDNPDFEVEDITKIQTMRIQCSYCRSEPKEVPAMVFHGHMTVDPDQDIEKDVVAIFCQGGGHCAGQAWAFPVEPDNNIIRKHNALPTITTDN